MEGKAEFSCLAGRTKNGALLSSPSDNDYDNDNYKRSFGPMFAALLLHFHSRFRYLAIAIATPSPTTPRPTPNPCGMSNFPEVNILNLLACVANAPRLRCTKRRHIATIRCGKGNRTAAGKCAKSPSNGVQWPTVQWAMRNPSGMVKRSAL